MTDEITTQPMLEALLEGQRQMATQLNALAAKQDESRAKLDALDAKIGALDAKVDAKVDALDAKVNALDAKVDALAGRMDRLEVRVAELISRVEDGFDDTTRKIEIFNDRLLSFEGWLKKVDRRLHDEILVRTR
jgi:peptidoglycan hydrolase CwlO-like protein